MTLAGRASGVTSNARKLDLSSPAGPPLLVIFTYIISYLGPGRLRIDTARYSPQIEVTFQMVDG